MSEKPITSRVDDHQKAIDTMHSDLYGDPTRQVRGIKPTQSDILLQQSRMMMMQMALTVAVFIVVITLLVLVIR